MATRELGPGKAYTDMAAAWAAAANDDTIDVFTGTYTGAGVNTQLVLAGKTGITIQAHAGNVPDFDALGTTANIWDFSTDVATIGISGINFLNPMSSCVILRNAVVGTVSDSTFLLGVAGNYGIFCFSANTATITGSTFRQYDGGGTPPAGSTYGVYSPVSGTISIGDNCTFFCLAIAVSAEGTSAVTVDRSLFHSHNGAIGTSYGFQNTGSGMCSVQNSIFKGYARATSNTGTDNKMAVYNCTIDTNTNGIFGTKYCSAIKNCIISNCTTGINGDGGGDQPAPDYCNFYNNTSDISMYTAATNSIDADPQYIDAATYDYSLNIASTSIDAGTDLSGTVDFDYLGVARPQNAVYDLGAYEHLPAGWAAGNVMGVTPAHIATVLSVAKADIATILGV